MASYVELNARPASAFLDSSAFRTKWDTNPERGASKYQETQAELRRFSAFYIGPNGTWFADGADGSFISSYEGIGYHAYTADLLQAVLDGSCPFYVYRYTERGNVATVKYDIRAMQAGRDGCIGPCGAGD